MSNLEATLARVEASLSRLVTSLETGGEASHDVSNLSAGYEAVCAELNDSIDGLTVLPSQTRPVVARISKLQAIAKQMVASDLDATSAELAKARTIRAALGRKSQDDPVGAGATGIDCNISG